MFNKKNTFFLLLLVFLPVSVAANLMDWGATVVFITAGLAIIPLAAFMGTATEEIAVVVGPNLGGLLNATFGNAYRINSGFYCSQSRLNRSS